MDFQMKQESKHKMPKYTGLKDFVRGCQKLLKLHGNIPVFLSHSDGTVSPFGIAIQTTELLGGEAMVFCGGQAHNPKHFEPGDCTD